MWSSIWARRGSCVVSRTAGIGFCFAPRYHPAMRHAVPIRRELGVPTAFNFLGPLANPARVRRQVVGVGDPAMAAKMARVLAAGGATHVLVVHGADGLDELSTTGPSVDVRVEGTGVEAPGGGSVEGRPVGGGDLSVEGRTVGAGDLTDRSRPADRSIPRSWACPSLGWPTCSEATPRPTPPWLGGCSPANPDLGEMWCC